MKLSKEVAKEMYNSGIESIKAFALENYPELEKKELPKSWEELESIDGAWVSGNDVTYDQNFSCIPRNQNIFKKTDQAAASIALAKLSQLKAEYNGDWVADWDNFHQIKQCIVPYQNDFQINYAYDSPKFLSFKNIKTAEKFLKNFKEDIILAKPLMS